MDDELVPVVLDFSGVAPDASISINITTPGLSWSLGSRIGDTTGASYNVVPEGLAAGNSCIREWMLNDNLLTIRTSVEAEARSSFTLGLFLRRHAMTDAFMGYCTLNAGATIRAQFGNQRPIEWRDGRISAVLELMAERFRRILFAVRGARPGSVVDIDLSTRVGAGKVAWTLGPSFAETQGVQVSSSGGGVPLSSFAYSPHRIRLVTERTGNTEPRDIAMLAYVSWMPDTLRFLYLRADCSAGIDLYAQVGNRQPQFLSQTFTLFSL